MNRLLYLLLPALVACAFSDVEEPGPEEAREHAKQEFLAGDAAYRRGDYAEAAGHFEAAYDYLEAPPLLFNIGQAHVKLGNCAEAEAAFDRYVATSGDRPPPIDFGERLEECERSQKR